MKKRFNGFEFWDGALFGAFVLLELVFVTAWLFEVFDKEYWPVVSRFVAIPVALLGALIAFSSTRFQISHAQERDLAAWRAVLPLALSEMMEVARNGILIAADQHPSHPANVSDISKILRLSPETISTLQSCIRSADKNTENWLSVVIGRYQIYANRAAGLANAQKPTSGLQGTSFSNVREDALLDWATFFALVEHHYDFARKTSESVPKHLDTSRIKSAFFLTVFHIQFDQRFEDRISWRLKRIADGDIRHFQFSR